MKEKWFSNRGQLLQLLVAILALLTALNAWTAVKQLDFFALAPVIFYLSFGVLLLVIIARLRKSPATSDFDKVLTAITPLKPPLSQTPAPPGKSSRTVTPVMATVTIKAGNFYDGSHIRRELKITLKDVLTTTVKRTFGGEEATEVADLEVTAGGSLFYGGSETKQTATNRYMCPVARHPHDAEPTSVFQFTYTQEYFSFLGVRVDHINSHTKEAVLTICFTSGILAN